MARRCRTDADLSAYEEYIALIAPHFFFGVAFVTAMTRSSWQIACAAQGAGFLASMTMILPAIRGCRTRLGLEPK